MHGVQRAGLLVGVRDRAGRAGARPARLLQRLPARRDRARPGGAARRVQGGRARARAAQPAACATGRGRSTSTCCCSASCEYDSERLTLPHPEVTLAALRARPAARAGPGPDAARTGGALADALAALGTRVRRSGASGRPLALGFAPCCWSSTSATPRRTSACSPTASDACPSTGASPPCASRPATSSGAALSNLLGLRGLAFARRRRARSSPRPCRSCPSSGRRWPGATSATRCWWSARRSGPGCRSATTTRTRSAPTGWPTRWRPTTACATRASIVDFGTAITYDVVVGGRRVPGRDHHPGRRDLDRRAVRARGQAAEGRARAAAGADRQVDRRRDPQRDRVRLRRSGRGDRAPAARRARADDDA